MLKLRLIFIKLAALYLNVKKTKKPVPSKPSFGVTVTSNKIRAYRAHTKRFYRNILKKRYIRHVKPDSFHTSVWLSKEVWNRPFKDKISFKSFFHIKIFFNISEFLMYDFYNFHRTMLNASTRYKNIPKKVIPKKPWKKLNFLYRIKYSIDTFRTHTLQFFKIKFKTDRKTTVFFNSLRGLNPLSYIWFFEYSLPYFLVKIRFAESISQGLLLTLSNLVFINGNAYFDRWDIVQPNDVIQLPFNIYVLVRLKWMVLRFFNFFKRTYKFFKRTILRSKKYRVKMPGITTKANHINVSKQFHLRLLESDYKSLTVILMPYANPTLYYASLTLFWLNFWNYRLNVWKYDI